MTNRTTLPALLFLPLLALGCAYAHVRSGVTPAGAFIDPLPELVADDLAAVAAAVLGGWSPGA